MAVNIGLNEQHEERRTHTRYKVREGAYAALSPDSTKMGQIVDISRGGLCFRYIVPKEQSDDTSETHVFVGDEGIYLEKMPNIVVEDISVENSAFGQRSMRAIRQRRVRFGLLTRNQLAQLDYFIINRTTGRA